MLGEWRSDQVQIGAANSDWALAPFKLSVRLIGCDLRFASELGAHLISNAIKFTPRDGQVVVTASRERARLLVTIEDNGVGIDENDLPRLGEAFFQASATREHRRDGSGLGLLIVKSLVHLHGGDVSIQSRIGEGTRVIVWLPFEGGSGTSTGDLITFVPERARALQ